MKAVLDHLDVLENAVPGLAGRMDHERIAAVGHSLGGQTVSLLLGMQVADPDDPRKKDLSDQRIRAGVVIAGPGVADDHLSARAGEMSPMLKHIDYTTMTGTALVINGDNDLNPNFSARLSYRSDAYTHSPEGNKTPRRPRTRTRPGSPRCVPSSGPTSAPNSASEIPPGRRP